MAILLEHYDHSQLVEAAGEYHPYSFLLNAAEVAPDAFGHAMNERGVSDSTVYELLEAKFGKMTDFSAPVFTYESYQDSFYATSNKPYHVRTLGDKRYELTNHLGNVLAVVSDRKIGVEDQGNPGTVEYYEADVVSAQDYYPFGMLMTGREYNAGEYRYGYQGYESDDEVAGGGNSYTTYYRKYDPRLGRWWSVDPADYIVNPYEGMANNPIMFADEKGDTIQIATNDEAINYEIGMDYKGDDDLAQESINVLNSIAEVGDGEKMLSKLVESESTYQILAQTLGEEDAAMSFSLSEDGGEITAGKLGELSKGQQIEALSHELFHAYQADVGQDPFTIDSEVGATLFGESIILRKGLPTSQMPGRSQQATTRYQNSFEPLLLNQTFDQVKFNQAVQNFKQGSSRNINGIYDDFPKKGLEDPAISDFYPLSE